MQMLQVAVQQGADLDKLQKLMDLHERWEASQARKAYTAAFALFKANPPKILKDRHVSYTTTRGTTEYNHASLANVTGSIVEGLSAVGITHRWAVEQKDKAISVTCVLTHVGGHSESTTLTSLPDESGGKNSIQAISSAVSYLQRYTILAATGLATDDQDDDARELGLGDDPKGYASPKGPPVEVDTGTVNRLHSRFMDALDADLEEVQKARAVYNVHLDAVKDSDVYIAVGTKLGTKQRAVKEYVAMHKKAMKDEPMSTNGK
jgi:hypothetical protein